MLSLLAERRLCKFPVRDDSLSESPSPGNLPCSLSNQKILCLPTSKRLAVFLFYNH